MRDRLQKASAICQLVAYISLVGVGMMWYNISTSVGIFFVVSTILAIIFIRVAMKPFNATEIKEETNLQ